MDNTSTSHRLPKAGETATYLTKDNGATYVPAAANEVPTHVKVDANDKVVIGGRRSSRSSKRGGKRSSRRGGSRASRR